MPRYNSVTPVSSVNNTATIATPQQGVLTTLTGTPPYTVTLADPRLYFGQSQSFYNTTGGIITLSVAAYGGPSIKNGSTTAFTYTMGNHSLVTLTSDGTNYVVTSYTLGSPVNVSVTGGYNALSNQVLWCNTSSAGFTVTLPANPVQGDTIRVIDAAGTFQTNNLNIGRNGQLIMGTNEDMQVAQQNAAFDMIYFDVTRGWRIFSI